MKPMLPSLTFKLPDDPGWFYEVKYDGFRALLIWDQHKIEITSRNEKSLSAQFPEIIEFLSKHKQQFKKFLPLTFDGELVHLENPYKASFSSIQGRGRLRAQKKIQDQASLSPCRLLVFDLLAFAGEAQGLLPFQQRKEKLTNLFQQLGLPMKPDPDDPGLIQLVPAYQSFPDIWKNITLYDGEGTVMKQKNSIWEEGKRTVKWLKYKNWKWVSCFITSFDKINGYFHVGVFKENHVQVIGQVLFGFQPDEKQALQQIISQNKLSEDDRFMFVKPAICLEVKYLEVYEKELREPYFDRFRFDLAPDDCTFERFLFQQKNLPLDLEITHPNKLVWAPLNIQKADYLYYLREAAPYMLPFLSDRLLTVIRFPHGTDGEPFYQKNCPDYAPEFVTTHEEEGIRYILCNNLETLFWLGNQLAIEFHIPFQTIQNAGPGEIVFDLDPPSIEDFHLAVKAARIIKNILDQLKLTGFIKTSGNKGLQIYLPLPDGTYSYRDTRLFTSFIADYLIAQDPDSFTIERMKKNRGGRLYIDYVQHCGGKTIVAPYSLRGNEFAGAATPLFWEEIEEKLDPRMFTMQSALKRIKQHLTPFKDYFQAKTRQNFEPVVSFLNAQKKG